MLTNPRGVNQSQSKLSRIFSEKGEKGEEQIGHLEPIHPLPTQDENVEGVPGGTREWPHPLPDLIQEPDVNVGPPETPGIPKGAGVWPSAMRDPDVPPADYSDVPDLPDQQGLPPFTQEPKVP